MRRLKKTVLIAVILCAFFVAFFSGCKNTSAPDPDPTPEPQPEPPAPEYTYIINGAQDYFVDISATADSFDLSSVYATRANSDIRYEVTVDFSAVNFGVKGKYTAVYSCGATVSEKSVYIYDTTAPEISGANTKTVSVGYDPLTGVSGKDQFGFSVTVSYIIKFDGAETDTLQTGDNTVEYTATDLVGNKATETVIFTVE